MYLSGMSYKQIAELIGRNFGLPEPSKATIYRWVQEYGDFAADGLSTQVPETSGHWVADEMVLCVGGQRMWNWNVMYRDEREAVAVFEKALRANGDVPPETITTDGLGSYGAAIGLMLPYTKHIISDGIYEKTNNNLSERLQKTFRSRTKTMDGLHGRASGQAYLDRWVLDYNHFKDHEALDGDVPARAAKVGIVLDEWTDLVREADKFKAAERAWESERKAERRNPTPSPGAPASTMHGGDNAPGVSGPWWRITNFVPFRAHPTPDQDPVGIGAPGRFCVGYPAPTGPVLFRRLVLRVPGFVHHGAVVWNCHRGLLGQK